MPPPCALVLFHFVLFLLCFPLGKLPLSFLTLKKHLNFGEQDTGRSFRRAAEYSAPHRIAGRPPYGLHWPQGSYPWEMRSSRLPV